MKGIICYYSGSGNTKLACTYIKQKIKSIDFELFDIIKDKTLNISNYDIIGFATFTDAWGVPKKFLDFMNNLESSNKYSFIFNTYGCISGKTLYIMKKLISKKGFNIIAGHSLHCPENYPPMIISNMGFENSPDTNELSKFNQFINELAQNILHIKENKQIIKSKISMKPIDLLLPKVIAQVFGSISGKEFSLNANLCTACGKCEKVCPYGAIKLNPKPTFDKNKCYACWACYNHCPKKAIFTKKCKGSGQYSKPNENLANKLKLDLDDINVTKGQGG